MALFPITRRKITVRALTRFPARVSASGGVAVTKANGEYGFALDFTSVTQIASLETDDVLIVQRADDSLAYITSEDAGIGAGGASAFTDLTDVPSSYTGHGSKAVRVNAGATGLEFVDLSALFQPLDAELTAIAGLTSAADRLPYFTGSGTASLATFTSLARNLLDDATGADMRATISAVKTATSSTDNAVPRFDGTAGNDLQNSKVTIDDDGNLFASTDGSSSGSPRTIGFNNLTSGEYTRIGDAGAGWQSGFGTTQQIYAYHGLEIIGARGTGTAPSFNAGSGTSDIPVSIIGNGVNSVAVAVTLGTLTVPDLAYDATSWNGSTAVPTRNAVRDQFEALSSVYQPLDSDLTSIAALTTTAAGRSVLTIADPNADRIVAWDDTAGSMAAIALADLTDEGSPATGDYVLIYGAEGDLRKTNWSNLPGAGGGLANVVEDTTPQLGGDLDANGFDIQFDTATGIRDDSDNEQLIFAKTASAVNYFQMTNSATGGVQRLEAAGGDADIAVTIASKGTDPINFEVNGNTEVSITASAMSPGANDGNALGTTALGWADLHLATGGVINWANGELLLTATDANTLTFSGGTLVLPASGLQVGSSNPFSDSAGTLTLQNVDALDATTESTIEAAIDTLANLTSVQGRTVTLADAGADAIFGWDDSANAYQNLSAADARTALGLVIGTNVQAWDADLDTWAGKTAPSGAAVGTSDTQTLTNKRITPRVGSTTSSATPTINTDNVDIYQLTAQAADITSFTTNLSGTPTEGQKLIIEITGTAARAITWGSSFEASTVALPTTTVTTNKLSVGFMWNGVTSKWRCMASA